MKDWTRKALQSLVTQMNLEKASRITIDCYFVESVFQHFFTPIIIIGLNLIIMLTESLVNLSLFIECLLRSLNRYFKLRVEVCK